VFRCCIGLLKVQVLGLGIDSLQVFRVRVKGSSSRVEAGGLRVQGSDFRAQEVIRSGGRVAVACHGHGPAKGGQGDEAKAAPCWG